MKTFKQIMTIAFVTLAFASCNQKEALAPLPQNDDGFLKTGECGNTFFTLFDVAGNPAGTLEIFNATTTTFFKFTPTTLNPNDAVTLTINGVLYDPPKTGPGQGGWYTHYWPTLVVAYVDGLGSCENENTFSFVATVGNYSASGNYTFECCTPPPPICYGDDDETAWAAGTRYVKKGNWATYTAYPPPTNPVILWAGQNMNAGSVTFEPDGDDVKITITMNDSWGFNPNESENVKIQEYDGPPPSKNPAPGQFDHKFFVANASPNVFEVTVPLGMYYGVHVDVVGAVPCD